MHAHNPTEAAADMLVDKLAHDFNNLWAHVLGYSRTTREDAPPQEIRRAFDRISESSGQGILYSRVSMNMMRRSRAHAEVIEAHDVVRDWVDLLTATVGSSLHAEYMPPSLPAPIRFDRNHLDLILMSIASDALTNASEDNAWLLARTTAHSAGNRPRYPKGWAHIVVIRGRGRPVGDNQQATFKSGEHLHAMRTLVEAADGELHISTIRNINVRICLRLPLAM